MLVMTEGSEIIHNEAYVLVKDERLDFVSITSQLLAGSLVISCTYSNVVFSSCVFYGCNLKQISFINCRFENCKFEFSHLNDSHFKNSQFKNCQWMASSAQRLVLEGCLMDEETFAFMSVNKNTISPNLMELEEPILELLAA